MEIAIARCATANRLNEIYLNIVVKYYNVFLFYFIGNFKGNFFAS